MMNKISDLLTKVTMMHQTQEPNSEKEFEKIYVLLRAKIRKETNPQPLAEALNRDIGELMYPHISLMFEIYQRAIQLDPTNENLITDFVDYVDIHSGPDWQEEVEQIRSLLHQNQIEEASNTALQIDYHKWDEISHPSSHKL